MKASSLILRLFTAALLLFASLGVTATTSYAMGLQQAKAAGIVGEKPDGYLGVVRPSAEANALAQSINQQRRAAYQGIAQKRGTSLSAVEQLAGQQAIGKTPAGQYIMSPSGQWIRK